MSNQKNIVNLNGCELHKIEFNEDGSVQGFCLKAGRIYIPFTGEDAKRLLISKVETEDELLGTITNYRINLEGLEFSEDFKFLSHLIGVDWYNECLKYVYASDNQEMNNLWKDKHDNQRANLW